MSPPQNTDPSPLELKNQYVETALLIAATYQYSGYAPEGARPPPGNARPTTTIRFNTTILTTTATTR